ncbi:WNT16 [Branchiostoma lanceolatum]|uniref:Protein Wnt n=1 Tax=Branchiostoma lanceolatum TaxID=7740 RepID=A0A8J9ZZS8_BRALA|nr:WNT16 [Branchiostoma lanceolatum]
MTHRCRPIKALLASTCRPSVRSRPMETGRWSAALRRNIFMNNADWSRLAERRVIVRGADFTCWRSGRDLQRTHPKDSSALDARMARNGRRRLSRLFMELLILAVLFPGRSFANLMLLSLSSVGSSRSGRSVSCGTAPGLIGRQKRLCRKYSHAVPSIMDGANKALGECRAQFSQERWNCSTRGGTQTFESFLGKGTRETAFIYAITSAAVVHAITQSCSAGNLTDCSCGRVTGDSDTLPARGSDLEGWKWGGCSDDIVFGMEFSKRFVDAADSRGRKKRSRNIRSMMNLHNNEVGRKAIQQQMSVKCRCHGVSGSCAVKTCWKTLPSFKRVGDMLKKKYMTSVPILRKTRRRLRRKQKMHRKVPIGDEELVYLEKSPNFCKSDKKRGIFGTRGRECNRTSTGPDSCNLLCCGRGYNTQVVRFVERCGCKFVWCCYVKCNTCETIIDKHTCK